MKKMAVALAVCAFMVVGADVAKADHYHRSNYNNPYRSSYRDNCDHGHYQGYRESYRYAPVYREVYVAPHCSTPVYAAPLYPYPNVGVGFSTKNFSFFYGR